MAFVSSIDGVLNNKYPPGLSRKSPAVSKIPSLYNFCINQDEPV